MSLDHLPSELRLELITLGRRYSSLKVRDYALKMAATCATYQTTLAQFGLLPSHVNQLNDALALYPEGMESRESTRLTKKDSAAGLRQAVKEGKLLRARAKAQLELALLDPALSLEARHGLKAALSATSSLPKDSSEGLTQHLNRLLSALGLAPNAAALIEPLRAAIEAVDAAHAVSVTSRDTTADTERLDLIDGALVMYMRAINKAAKAAAKALGQPSLAAAFSLKGLR